MALDFPSTGLTVGQIFTSGGASWKWDGTKWVSNAASDGYLPLVGGTINGSPGSLVIGVPPGSAPSRGSLIANLNATAAPPAPANVGNTGLQIVGADAAPAVLDVVSSAGIPQIALRTANGTIAAPTAVANANNLGAYGTRGYGTSAWSSTTGSLQFVATENWTNANHGTAAQIYTTPNGGGAVSVAVTVQNGVQVGAPTGGDKGAGTLNATSVYAAGVLLTSDASLKRDIEPLPNDCLALVGAIEPKRFKFIDPGPTPNEDPDIGPTPAGPPGWFDKTRWGFVAQDVEAAMHEYDFDGVEAAADGIRSLDYNAMIAVLWKAVRELSAEIDRLKGGATSA